MVATVDALLPLSLLEAVRDIDTPAGDFETEFVPELRNKRFGLSETVYAQIRRYSDAVKRNQRSSYDEAVALARLIGRRPDAEAVFREAGRVLAHATYVTVSPFTRRMLQSVPGMLSRPMALRRTRKLARRYLNGTIARRGNSVLLEVPASVTADAAQRAAGCAYYETSLREILRLLTGTASSVEHVRCSARGEGSCQWRAEWSR
jgi:hypothetical protein